MMSDVSEHTILSLIRSRLPEFEPDGNLQELTGGNLNHVWRLNGKTHSLIIKHAPPYIASSPDVPLSSDRLGFEARALQLFQPLGTLSDLANNGFRPPEPFFYDSEHSILVMEDLGEMKPLGRGIPGLISAGKIGYELGTFIGNLHRSTYQKEPFRKDFNNKQIQSTRNRLQYQPAFEYAEIQESGLSEKIKKLTQNLGNLLLKPGICLVMGDLWPPSLFIGREQKLRLIDWEFVHFGRPLQDVAHFAAHCVMQHQTADTQKETDEWVKIWDEFWGGYQTITGSYFNKLIDKQEFKKMYVHAGAEILIRAAGPFKEGYVYENLSQNDELVKEAKNIAIQFILKPPEEIESFNPF